MLRWIDTLFPRRALFQRDRRLLHLFIGRLLASTGFSIVIPFLGLYLHGERGVPMSIVGGLFFVAALAGAAGQVVGGELSDRHGRKVVLVGAQLGRGVSFLGLGAAVLLHADVVGFGLLTAASAFAGRLFEPPSAAMVADIAEGEARVESYAILRVAGNLGWALGPAIGGFLAALSYPLLFLIASGLLFASALFIALRVEETAPHRRPRLGEAESARQIPPIAPPGGAIGRFGLGDLMETLRDRRFHEFCWISAILFTVMAQLISTLSVYIVEWAGLSKVQLGTLYSLNGLMVVFLQFPIVKFLAPLRMTTALIAGSFLYAAGYAMMGVGRSMELFVVAMVVVTLGELVTSPPSLNLAASFSPEARRGRTMGVYGLFNSLGWSLGPLVGGVMLDLSARRSMLLWSAIAALAIAAAGGFWDLRRRLDKAMDQNDSRRIG